MPEIDDWIHPLEALAKRESLADASIRVIVLTDTDEAGASIVGRGLVKLIEQRKRSADFVVASVRPSWSEALKQGVSGSDHPIVLVTTASQAWSLGHLDPLLKAIDDKDHVIGRRPLTWAQRAGRWFRHLPWKALFASPILDLHSPCRIHRREALEQLALQSESSFLEIELIAKATYLKQLIDEVSIPDLNRFEDTRSISADLRMVWSRPTFRPLKTT